MVPKFIEGNEPGRYRMPDGLDLVIYFVGSGLAFFVGIGLILFGVALSPFAQRRPIALARNLLVLIGGLLVTISATPLDGWLYGALALFTSIWLGLEWFGEGRKVCAARLAIAVVWLAALALEVPSHITPKLPPLGNPRLFLIGDSVSAGMAVGEKGRWPTLIAEEHNVPLVDLSVMGATVKSAMKQAEAIDAGSGLVLLEIGGNDLLGNTKPEQFEKQLDLLLASVCQPDRTVAMLELPLPPFSNRFGQSQRRLARKHGVVLVPRRVFISVLTSRGATVDGVHLSPTGHRLMADAMWQIVRPAYGAE